MGTRKISFESRHQFHSTEWKDFNDIDTSFEKTNEVTILSTPFCPTCFWDECINTFMVLTKCSICQNHSHGTLWLDFIDQFKEFPKNTKKITVKRIMLIEKSLTIYRCLHQEQISITEERHLKKTVKKYLRRKRH